MTARPAWGKSRSSLGPPGRLRPSWHLSLVIPELGPGGAERVLVRLAQHWAGCGFRLSVITLAPKGRSFYQLPLAAHWVGLGVAGPTCSLGEKVGANFRRLKFLRQVFDRLRPDVIISFLAETNVLSVLANLGRRTPVIVTEHSNPRVLPTVGIWRLARRIVYPLATKVVSVSPGVDSYFGFLPRAKRRVIPNGVPVEEIDHTAPCPDGFPWPHAIISMGRLEGEKGFDLLLQAVGPLFTRYQDWGLVILGEGTGRQRLCQLAENLGMADRMLLPGPEDPPYPRLKRADIFALPSRHEGFGIAVVEAMACGLPVVASACRPGPGEIITAGVDGLLVPPGDVPALRKAVEQLIVDEELRRNLAAEAVRSAKRFDLPRVLTAWDQLLAEVLAQSTQEA
ncbi:MAG: glycosyltransferase family 4 protein [Thermoguttaceae bacterium]|nr:glycosyltransferase family 4 protein [Thermoguttaceae bacterium]MDW8078003.1 glycosyltransferase family 4 protein [Thermoguttaceae bacterium]